MQRVFSDGMNCHSDRIVCICTVSQLVKRNFQCELSVILSHINLLNSDKILHNHILLFLLLLSSVWKTDFTLICICSSFSLKIKRRVFLSLSPSLCLHSAPHMGRQTNTVSTFMDSNVSFEWNYISIPVAWVTLKRGERRRGKKTQSICQFVLQRKNRDNSNKMCLIRMAIK